MVHRLYVPAERMDEEWVEYDGGEVQEWHRSARRVRVAPGVTVIPDGAFRACFELRAVDLSNVTTISGRAFLHCTLLEHVIWTTASAVEIGEYAFYGCEKLEEINLSNVTKIGFGAFLRCDALSRVNILSAAAIEARAFEDCTNLTVVELDWGIQRIGEQAFKNCGGLARISIPSSVTDIGDDAFSRCTSLVEVTLSEGLQQIGARAFQECTSLQNINIPSTTLNVGRLAFFNCNQLRNAELREGLQTIGEAAFRVCSSLEHITIPSSVTFVGEQTFQYCRSLAEVTLREGIHHIDTEAFGSSAALRHINIPPVAFMIDIEQSRCWLLRTATTTPATLEIRLVVSKWMQYRNPSQLGKAEAKVNEILGRQETKEEKIKSIREWCAYFDLLDVTTLLELAIWRANMDDEEDTEARQASRRNCGSDVNIIILSVLPFLEG